MANSVSTPYDECDAAMQRCGDASIAASLHRRIAMAHAAGLVAEGRLSEAAAIYRQAAAEYPDQPGPHYELGLLHHQRGEIAEAVACFERAAPLMPRDASIWNNLGVLHYTQGDHGKAEQCFRQAVALDPQYAEAWYGLGKASQGARRYGDAIVAFGACLRGQPDHTRAKEALSALKAAGAGKPRVGFVSLWYERGQAYVTQMLRNVVTIEHQAFVLARNGGTADRRLLSSEGEWAIPNLTTHPEYALPRDVVRRWIADHGLQVVLFNEEYDFGLVQEARQAGARTIGIYYWELFNPAWADIANAWYDAVICPIRCSYDRFRELGITRAEYVPWGVDTAQFRPADRPVSDRIRFFHPAGWGGLHARRGTQAVIDAFLAANLPDAELLVHTQHGEGVERHGNITIHHGTVPREELVRMYQESDVAVLPSKWEGLGLTFLEAMGCGLPIITVDAPPMNEFVTHGETGLLCPVAERRRYEGIFVEGVETGLEELARAMARLAGRDLLATMRAATLRRAPEYAWSRRGRAVLEIVARVIADPFPPPTSPASGPTGQVRAPDHDRRCGMRNISPSPAPRVGDAAHAHVAFFAPTWGGEVDDLALAHIEALRDLGTHVTVNAAEDDCSCVFSYGNVVAEMASSVARQRRLPLFAYVLDIPFWRLDSPPFIDHYRRFREVLADSDHVLALSAETAKAVKEFAGRDATVWRMGLPMAELDLSRKELAVEPDNQIAFVSRIVEHKHPEVIIEALAAIPNPPRLLMMGKSGEQPLIEKCRQLARQRGVDLGIVMGAPTLEVARQIRLSRFLVSASIFEGLGMTPGEALLLERPALVSDLPVFREVYGDHVEYFAPLDAADLAQNMLRLLSDDEYCARRGREGRRFALENLGLRQAAVALQRFLDAHATPPPAHRSALWPAVPESHHSSEYDGAYYWRTEARTRYVFQPMAAYLATAFYPECVLDVGCGMAFLVKWLRNYRVRAYGCDYSQFAVEHASDLCYLAPGGLDVRGYLQRASAENLPYADNSYDLVSCLDLLEHLEAPNAIRAIQELERVTSRFLFMIITVHNESDPELILPKGSKGDPTHVTVAGEGFWRRQLAEHTRLRRRRDLEEGARRDLGRILPWTFFIYEKATGAGAAQRQQRPGASA